MSNLLKEWLATIGWGAVGILIMSTGYLFIFQVLDKFTANIEEIEELKKGNTAMGIVIAGLLISFALVISAAMKLL